MADAGAIGVTPDAFKYFVSLAQSVSFSTPTGTTQPTAFTQPTGLTTPENSGLACTFNAVVQEHAYRYLPVWAYDYRGYYPNSTSTPQIPRVGIPVTGTISGQVQENGTPAAGKIVLLYYRLNNQLIARTTSDASGNFTFVGLEPGNNKYYVVSINNLPLQYDIVAHDTIAAI